MGRRKITVSWLSFVEAHIHPISPSTIHAPTTTVSHVVDAYFPPTAPFQLQTLPNPAAHSYVHFSLRVLPHSQ
jgi:hypothetical protein